MNEVTIVGCDLHDRSMLLKFAVGKEDPQQKSFRNDREGREAMIRFLFEFSRQRRTARIVFVYEASGQGYGLHDLLSDQGIECHVLSPSHLPKTAKGKRNKTDAKDAQMLFEQARGYVLAGNKLPVVWTPPQALRNDRELVRARLETAEACTRVKLQVFSLLKRYGQSLPAWFETSRTWSRRFLHWLKEEQAELLAEVVRPVLRVLVERSKKAVVALMRKLGIQMWHRALEAGVAGELVAPATPPPRWVDWTEDAPPILSTVG